MEKDKDFFNMDFGAPHFKQGTYIIDLHPFMNLSAHTSQTFMAYPALIFSWAVACSHAKFTMLSAKSAIKTVKPSRYYYCP